MGFATRPVCRTCIAVSHPYGPAPLAGPPALQEPREATGVYVRCTGSRTCEGIHFFDVANERGSWRQGRSRKGTARRLASPPPPPSATWSISVRLLDLVAPDRAEISPRGVSAVTASPNSGRAPAPGDSDLRFAAVSLYIRAVLLLRRAKVPILFRPRRVTIHMHPDIPRVSLSSENITPIMSVKNAFTSSECAWPRG